MRPLDGVRVVDFSRVLAGPMATQILAEMGADVIKVERPRTGDESRVFPPRLPQGESAYFFAFNRGKRSITLDLKSDDGRTIARRIAAEADVVVENFLPGAMASLGLGYDDLSSDNPGVVYVSLTGFGQTGPHRDRRGYDTVFQALSGVMHLTGEHDGPPAKVGVPAADMTSGLWAVIAALAGLAGRAQSGVGTHVDLSMMDIQVSLLALASARLFALGDDPTRMGTEHPGRVPSAAFVCADGRWLHISCSDQHWSALCEVLGLQALAADPALNTNDGRLAQRDRITAAVAEAMLGRDTVTWADALRGAGVPAGRVNSVREILDDDQTRAREMVGSFEHTSEGEFPALRTPVRMSGYPRSDLLAPPLLGADTETVLRELGYSAGEIDGFRDRGVF